MFNRADVPVDAPEVRVSRRRSSLSARTTLPRIASARSRQRPARRSWRDLLLLPCCAFVQQRVPPFTRV